MTMTTTWRDLSRFHHNTHTNIRVKKKIFWHFNGKFKFFFSLIKLWVLKFIGMLQFRAYEDKLADYAFAHYHQCTSERERSWFIQNYIELQYDRMRARAKERKLRCTATLLLMCDPKIVGIALNERLIIISFLCCCSYGGTHMHTREREMKICCQIPWWTHPQCNFIIFQSSFCFCFQEIVIFWFCCTGLGIK